MKGRYAQYINVAVYCLVAASCTAVNSVPDTLTVYYRGFDSESIVSLSATDLPAAGSRRFEISDKVQIHEFMEAIEGPCVKAPPEYKDHSVRLLVKPMNRPERQWEASRFFYRNSDSGALCLFDAVRKEKVVKALRL